MSDLREMLDLLDIDIVVKVLRRTLLSPFFAFFVPVLYKAQGLPWDSPIVIQTGCYFVIVSLIYIFTESSSVWRNGFGSLLRRRKIDWEDQIVVITGGASGVGALLANTLAVRNVTVAVLDVQPFVTENSNIEYYKCDVSKWEEVQAVAKRIHEQIGSPTIVINNAGVVQGKPIVDLTPSDIQQTFGVNTLAHFWTLKAFLPDMIQRKEGHIVTVSSVLGMAGAARLADYCASKAALISLHESLRYELDHVYKTSSIRTTLLAPGYIHTSLFSNSRFVSSKSNPSPLPRSLQRFLAPPLPPHVVVKAIIAALDEQESRDIYLPWFVNFVPAVRILPSWGRDFFQWISGADHAMESFVKVSGRRDSEATAVAAK